MTTELALRVSNGLRKAVAGLPLGGEAVWPGLRNDLFVAHESIYSFAARWVAGKRVLDAACGTGYGSALLLQKGAASVVGVDTCARRLAFARRRYAGVDFRLRDCEQLGFPAGEFDVVVSSNTLEHLDDPRRFLRGAARSLRQAGSLIIAVPPVLSDSDLIAHHCNEHHVSNYSVQDWHDLLLEFSSVVTCFRHDCRRGLDFESFVRSSATADDFTFQQLASVRDAYQEPTISAVFACEALGDGTGAEKGEGR